MKTTSTTQVRTFFSKKSARLFLTFFSLIIFQTSFAWHVVSYTTSGCSGGTIKVHANVSVSENNIYYHWQYKDNAGIWKCFSNSSSNTINGTNFTASGSTSNTTGGNFNPTDLSINNSANTLENVQIRLLMGQGGDPYPCGSQTNVANSDNMQNTILIRLHNYSGSDCGGTTPGCIGNLLFDNTYGYYAGFEAGSNNFTTTTGKSDFGAGTVNSSTPGKYSVQNNPYAYRTSFGQFAPHTGSNQMVVNGSSTITDRVWYKSVGVSAGGVYTFCAWAAKVDATQPKIQLKVNGAEVAATDLSTSAIGAWIEICGSYTIPAGVTSVEIAVLNKNATGGADNFSLDDLCFTLTTPPPPPSDCGCTTSTTNLLTNPSFENGTTGYSWSGGNLTTGTGYVICGSKNAFLDETSGTAKVWQQVTSIAPASVVTFKGWAGTHTPGISCSPKLTLAFYNASSVLISSTSVTVDKDVDKPDYKLKQYTISALAPAGTFYTRVEGSIGCNTLKLDALCLTATSPGPLPIGIINFQGNYSNGVGMLNWKTGTEINSNYFEIERSDDGVAFAEVNKVNAKGIASDYNFVDRQMMPGTNFYRLKIVDKNNSFTYSNIIKLRAEIKGTIITATYPNPFVDHVTITIASEISEPNVSVRILDNTGRQLKVQTTHLQKGINQISFDNLSALSSNLYIIEVKTVNGMNTVKLKK